MAKALYKNIETSDITIENFDFKLTDNEADFIRQRIDTVLKTFEGEIFWNEELGLPWFTRILKKNPNFREINGILRNAILSVDGVAEIESYESDFDSANRNFLVNFIVTTNTGETIEGESAI